MERNVVLVTGGAGYIGAVMVPELVGRGRRVRVFDKLYFGDRALKSVRDKIELVEGDVRQFDPELLADVSEVIHLGSLSNDPTAEFDPAANHAINFEGTMRVAEACLKMGVKRFNFASSAAVIGFHVDDIADEDYPANPQSEYAQSKLDAENGLKSLVSDNFHPVIIRQATVFGPSPRMRWDLVVNTMTRDSFSSNSIFVYCEGDNWRPLVHVKDVVAAHLVCLTAPFKNISGQIFNLVHQNYRVLELGYLIRDTLNKYIPVSIKVQSGAKESRSYRLSKDKFSRVLGFNANLTVEDSAVEIYNILRTGKFTDFSNPVYYNLDWMKLLIKNSELNPLSVEWKAKG